MYSLHKGTPRISPERQRDGLPVNRWRRNLQPVSLYVTRPRRLSLLTPFLLVWSNFEIGDLRFWRGEAYSKYFDHLDHAGGFYYEVRPSFLFKYGALTNIIIIAVG